MSPRRGGCAIAALALLVVVAGPGASDAASPRAANNSFRASLISACVPVRNPASTPALAFDGARLPFELATGDEPGSRPRCRSGELRLLRLQALSIGGQRTYVRRGGCALPCVVRQATVHVAAAALKRPVRLLGVAARNGNGAAVGGCDRTVRNAPQHVTATLRRMFYKTPAELRRRRNAGRSGGDGARWSNYGNPGATYATAGRSPTPYNYLLWNLPRTPRGLLPGGGIVEAILPAGAPLALCAGERLRLAAFDRRGARNGHVDFGYARVRGASPSGGSYAIYGWVLLGYRYRAKPYTATTIAPTRRAP
ncbi:MAG TPA: hypothetical protein VGV90_09840, partial [Solirubrobacteraceae bacterium]|nr:hypothetical protein [Solirubrobacteraceae bacterium]